MILDISTLELTWELPEPQLVSYIPAPVLELTWELPEPQLLVYAPAQYDAYIRYEFEADVKLD
jgi:hypothetical protein